MNYSDGRPVRVGDLVDLGTGMTGFVVAVIDDGAYSPKYPASAWAYLQEGALLESKALGVLHCTDASHDFALIARTTAQGSP